jgi:hypothetical protein
MKILLIPSGSSDYLQDSIFLGLKDLYGNDVESTLDCSYLYKNCIIEPNHYWGKGFSYTNILDESLHTISENIIEKVSENYYDLIIFTFVSRNSSMLDEIMKITNGKRVVLVNGEDENWRFENYNEKIIYFKRELIEKKENNIFPIGYSIHSTKLYHGDKIIQKDFSDSIPSMDNCTTISSSKFIFDNEYDYYLDYQISKFGYTKKKGGWDSMRHYEILANKCVPLFENIDLCPELILTKLPKKLLIEINEKYPYLKDNEYNFYNNELFNYTIENLTTDKMAKYLLNICLNYD